MAEVRNGNSVPGQFQILEPVFFAAFAVEVLSRLSLERPRRFFCEKDALWNVVDVVATVLLGIEVLGIVVSVGNATFVRSLRLLRLLRAFRMFKLFRGMRVIRLLLTSIGTVLRPLVATLGLLAFVLYIATLGLGQAVLSYMEQNQGALSNDHPVMEMYGSPWIMMVSLLAACVGGADWLVLLRPLRDVSSLLVLFFVVVVVFVIFGLANLLTSVLTDSIIRDGRTSERLLIRARFGEHQSALNRLRDFLSESANLKGGLMERQVASKALKSEEGTRILKAADVEPQTALGLLKLLDTEGTGAIIVEEFLCSLTQLQAENLSVHMATNMYESRKILRSIAEVKRLLEAQEVVCLSEQEDGAP